MKFFKSSEGRWIEGKNEMKYKKRILMENVPPSINLIEDIIITANGKIPSHAHENTDEIFYITKGKAIVKVGKEELKVGRGDMIFIEKGEEHSFTKDSDENFEMIVLKINFKGDDAILYEEAIE